MTLLGLFGATWWIYTNEIVSWEDSFASGTNIEYLRNGKPDSVENNMEGARVMTIVFKTDKSGEVTSVVRAAQTSEPISVYEKIHRFNGTKTLIGTYKITSEVGVSRAYSMVNKKFIYQVSITLTEVS